jgi:hypothetical protein
MDLNAPGTNYRPQGKGCGPNQPPANVVWESRKISQAENHVETFFLSFEGLPPRRRPSFQKIGRPAIPPLMSIKMELKRPLVYKFIVFVLHGLDPIACFLDLNGFGWPWNGFGDPGHGFYSISMLTAWI